jgi:signal transduction histidine kinase
VTVVRLAGSLELRADLVCMLAEHALAPASALPDERAEAERRHDQILSMLGASEVPLAVIELPGRAVRLVNDAWRDLFALAPDAAPLSRVPADMLAQIDRIAERDSGRVDVPELNLSTSLRPAHFTLITRPLHGAQGSIIGAVIVCADITDDVIARDLDVDRDTLVWGGPMNGETDYVNGAWNRYTGAVPVTGPWIHPDDRSRCAHAFVEAARQRASSDIEVRLRRGDGEYRWHRVRFSKDGERWYGIAHDIHDARNVAVERDELGVRERAARADAEQANRLKDQFLAAVSHELRAPLTTMLLWEKVLRGTNESDELRAKALEVIRLSVQAQSRIVGDLLDVSRAASGKLHVDLRQVDVGTLLEEAITAAAPSAVAKQVTLVRDGSTLLGDVQGDASRLRQVLENLLSNAIKFTEPGGRVTVSASRHGRTVVISVVDTGRGIPADFMPRLFEPFTQVEDELTRRAGGLGLGLAIAKQLIELHHGVLTAASDGLGRGATFTIALPASRTRRTPSPPLAVTRAQLLRGKNILVIDDDGRVRDALALLLERAGASITTADSAQSARARIEQATPQALVCDIAMPGEDGYSFIQAVRARGLRAPAVALTAHASELAARRAIEAGFDRHLAKPIDVDRLIVCLHELVTSPR